MEYSLVGLLILILDIWAIISVLQSGISPGMKLVWIVVILLLPVIGMLLWFLLGQSRTAGRL